jgi:hypothetical protein
MSDTLRRAIEDEGGLVSVSDLARAWGVSSERVRQITDEASFPQPLDTINAGGGRKPQRIWSREDADEYRLTMRRRA